MTDFYVIVSLRKSQEFGSEWEKLFK